MAESVNYSLMYSGVQVVQLGQQFVITHQDSNSYTEGHS